MSHEDDKIKHSKRLHKKESAITKQVKIAKTHGLEIKEPHKLAKHHALDCGVPNCPMCSSPRKVTGEKTIQEQSFKQTEKWND
jgi:CRISPR/Cas system Type II protein with McrA/HNH and RuvC-like nuclease domain